MQNDRLSRLLEMEKSDNQDVTLKYMIGLEYKNNSNDKCEEYFILLKKEYPEYLATYYTAGEYYYNKEDYDNSTLFLRKGIEIATKQENKKTLDELKNLLFNVEMET